MLRTATEQDKRALRDFFKFIFDDPDEFCNFFSDYRFLPEWTFGEFEDGRPISVLYTAPMPVTVRGITIPAAMLCGVSTHPDYSGKGLMRRCLTFAAGELSRRGLAVFVHTPSNFAVYRSFSHLATSDKLVFKSENYRREGRADLRPLTLADAEKLLPFYRSCGARYSGLALRSQEEMKLKMRDYISCGALLSQTGRGYAIFSADQKSMQLFELMAPDASAAEQLLSRALPFCAGRALSLRLPPDLAVSGFALERTPNGVCGLINPAALLRCFGGGETIEVTDAFAQQNSGVWNMSGEKLAQPESGRAPAARFTAGGLLQFLWGYKSLSQLEESAQAKALEGAAAAALEQKYPPQTCFIVDEY